MRAVGQLGLLLIALAAILAPGLTPHDPNRRFVDRSFAPPMAVHVVDDSGRWRMPFVYPVILAGRLERRYDVDRAHPMPVRLMSGGAFVGVEDEGSGPWLPLGADSLGRDIWARVLYGARVSLAVAVAAALGALCLGTLVGAVAGLRGGWIDEVLMRLADFVIVLPAMYVVLALRAALPLVLPGAAVFALVTGMLALIGWPVVARGVRAIVAVESTRDYAQAAIAAGAGPGRLLSRHLLPAARGFLSTQATLLLPAFMLAEATLSFVGLGFQDPVVSLGGALQEAASASALADAPWTLAPAAGIFLTALFANLATERRGARA